MVLQFVRLICIILFLSTNLVLAGYDLIQEALLTTAEALESIFNQTISAMNSGLRLQEVVDKVKLSPELLKKPYLNPQYDQIDFIVRNIWRLYGGWWDGNPSHLEPVSNTILSSEIIRLSGGVRPVMDRVTVLLTNPTTENIAVACHLVCIFTSYLKSFLILYFRWNTLFQLIHLIK